MNFEEFYKKRQNYKDWMTANGLNEGAPEKNGEFKAFNTLKSHCDVFLDVGSNKGIFIDQWNTSVSDSTGFALVFEPNPNLGTVLQKKITRGKLVQKAVSNKKGTAEFNIYTSDNTTSSLMNRSDMMPHFTDAVTNLKVEIDTLDSYLALIQEESKKGVFVKIDVEGVELLVLQGAQKMLAALPEVFLMFEYSKAWQIGNHTVKDAFHLLDRLGYRLFRITPLGLEDLRFYSPEMDGPDYCNYFAVKGFNLKEILQSKSIPSVTHNWNDFYLFP